LLLGQKKCRELLVNEKSEFHLQAVLCISGSRRHGSFETGLASNPGFHLAKARAIVLMGIQRRAFFGQNPGVIIEAIGFVCVPACAGIVNQAKDDIAHWVRLGSPMASAWPFCYCI